MTCWCALQTPCIYVSMCAYIVVSSNTSTSGLCALMVSLMIVVMSHSYSCDVFLCVFKLRFIKGHKKNRCSRAHRLICSWTLCHCLGVNTLNTNESGCLPTHSLYLVLVVVPLSSLCFGSILVSNVQFHPPWIKILCLIAYPQLKSPVST